ncbi:MAG: hypothetical protein RL235_312 [Chlamydiota bacterium]|jgi:8-oxo-dGTP pyrophosphatase MutT (NUDIX family)
MGQYTYEIFFEEPLLFQKNGDVAACYLHWDGRLLLLQCGDHKDFAGMWGVPGGKREQGESILECAQRELYEETQIALDLACFTLVRSAFIRRDTVAYRYEMVRVDLSQSPAVAVSAEHKNYTWANRQEMERMPMIPGYFELLDEYERASLL